VFVVFSGDDSASDEVPASAAAIPAQKEADPEKAAELAKCTYEPKLANELSACESLPEVVQCAQPFPAISDCSGRLVGYAADAAAWAAKVEDHRWAAASATTALIAKRRSTEVGSLRVPWCERPSCSEPAGANGWPQWPQKRA